MLSRRMEDVEQEDPPADGSSSDGSSSGSYCWILLLMEGGGCGSSSFPTPRTSGLCSLVHRLLRARPHAVPLRAVLLLRACRLCCCCGLCCFEIGIMGDHLRRLPCKGATIKGGYRMKAY